jgi:prepilin-type N-terminal cleavage/methylation domain-containing protein/prepilin-type processing-associated H-X9-DG protein
MKTTRSEEKTMTRKSRQGFTLIELLVVIAICMILMALAAPAVTAALGSGRAVNSLSNLRQWGSALYSYLGDSGGVMPWDGVDSVSASIGASNWWANALPPYVGCRPYRELAATGQVPLPPERSIFLDPSARMPPSAPHKSGNTPFFFCYVPNSKLNSSQPNNACIRASQISRPAATVFMVEMRTRRDEVPPSDPFYSKSLDRAKADWQRFANRHRGGGHVVFVDGHSAHVSYAKAITQTGGDYNQSDLIWNPLGAAK